MRHRRDANGQRVYAMTRKSSPAQDNYNRSPCFEPTEFQESVLSNQDVLCPCQFVCASAVGVSAECKACRICSWRSHFSAGVKYQDKTAKTVTVPKMTQAKLNDSASTGKKNGEIMTWKRPISHGTLIEGRKTTDSEHEPVEQCSGQVHRHRELSKVKVR